MSQLQNNEINQPVTVVSVRGEEFVFLRVRDLQALPPAPHSLPLPTPQTVCDRGSLETFKILLWFACGVGFVMVLALLRSPAPPVAPQPVVMPQPEKKRHSSRECHPAGLFGLSQICSEKEWWE